MLSYRASDQRQRSMALAIVRDRMLQRPFAIFAAVMVAYAVLIAATSGWPEASAYVFLLAIVTSSVFWVARRRLIAAAEAYGVTVTVTFGDRDVTVEQERRLLRLPLRQIVKLRCSRTAVLLRWPDHQYLVVPAETVPEGLIAFVEERMTSR